MSRKVNVPKVRQNHNDTTETSEPEVLRRQCRTSPDGGEKRGRNLVNTTSGLAYRSHTPGGTDSLLMVMKSISNTTKENIDFTYRTAGVKTFSEFNNELSGA